MRKRSWWIVLAAAALAATACDRPSNDVSAASSPPPMKTPVGPVPGPDENPTRPNNPYNGDRSSAGEGRQLFVRFNCSGCHGGRAGGGMGPSLRDVDWIYGNDDAQVVLERGPVDDQLAQLPGPAGPVGLP